MCIYELMFSGETIFTNMTMSAAMVYIVYGVFFDHYVLTSGGSGKLKKSDNDHILTWRNPPSSPVAAAAGDRTEMTSAAAASSSASSATQGRQNLTEQRIPERHGHGSYTTSPMGECVAVVLHHLKDKEWGESWAMPSPGPSSRPPPDNNELGNLENRRNGPPERRNVEESPVFPSGSGSRGSWRNPVFPSGSGNSRLPHVEESPVGSNASDGISKQFSDMLTKFIPRSVVTTYRTFTGATHQGDIVGNHQQVAMAASTAKTQLGTDPGQCVRGPSGAAAKAERERVRMLKGFAARGVEKYAGRFPVHVRCLVRAVSCGQETEKPGDNAKKNAPSSAAPAAKSFSPFTTPLCTNSYCITSSRPRSIRRNIRPGFGSGIDRNSIMNTRSSSRNNWGLHREDTTGVGGKFRTLLLNFVSGTVLLEFIRDGGFLLVRFCRLCRVGCAELVLRVRLVSVGCPPGSGVVCRKWQHC